MALITDINTSGASALTIYAGPGLFQVLISGTWSGATVALEKNVGGSWVSVRNYTEDAYEVVENVNTGSFRMTTAGSPSLVCDVIFPGQQLSTGPGRVE